MRYPAGKGEWIIDFDFLHAIANNAKWAELYGNEEAIEDILLLAEEKLAAAEGPGKPPAEAQEPGEEKSADDQR